MFFSNSREVLKGLCVPMMSHPGVENEGLLLSLRQKNWGSGHGRLAGFRRVLPVGTELLPTSWKPGTLGLASIVWALQAAVASGALVIMV